ncbi:unnamed protein product [Polarella glacialis]|uniref:GH18 domain-containing protein n=1 Tax=Polarella glacialis TaxID=89957 RepID=A0A813GGE9_POLGL|nr:unnamed protein product [Polarella glacialis]
MGPCLIFLTSLLFGIAVAEGEVNVPVAGPAPGCSVDSEEVGLLQGPQRFKAQGSVPLTADRGGSEVRKPGCQRGGKGATTTTNTTTTTKLALTITTQPDVVGYYVWTWSSSTTVPTGATIGVCFSGYAEVATALSQCSSVEANLVGTKYLSIGGGGKNDYGLITADRLTAVGAAAATILSAGYEGVIFDIEEVSGSTDEINDALDAAVAALKASGLAAAVTTSHSCPYKCTGCDSSALVASWLKNADIGMLSPQLYTLGTESKIDTTPTAGCPWSLYANATAVVAPSIVQASQYDSAEAFFATEGVTTGGYFVWATSSSPSGCSSCSGGDNCYVSGWAVPCSTTDQSTCTSEGGDWCGSGCSTCS